MQTPLVSIIILNWNGAGLIQECLESLKRIEYPTIEIVVVDNFSTDESLAYLEQIKTIKLIRNPENYGFAKGNNIGFIAAKGKYVVTLNNDIIVEPSWLNEPIKRLEEDSQIGIISCRQMNYFDREKIDVVYHIVTKSLSFFPFGIDKKVTDDKVYSQTGYVLSASGGSAIYRKEMLNDLGGFDERFFAYCEDVDLSLQAFYNSWKCLYVPQAVVYHRGSASFKKIPEKTSFYGQRNRYFLYCKHFPTILILRQLPWIFGNELLQFYWICIKKKQLKLYMSIMYSAITNLMGMLSERKDNVPLFKQNLERFLLFKKEKILFID